MTMRPSLARTLRRPLAEHPRKTVAADDGVLRRVIAGQPRMIAVDRQGFLMQ